MTSAGGLLIGTHTFAASGDAARRQANGVASLRALERATVVNLQFIDEAHEVDGVETLAVLREDARRATGREGARKGIVSELLSALAAEATRRRCQYFCLTNADILWTQDAVDWILSAGKEAYAFSRMDFDGATGRDLAIALSGVDAIAMQPGWFRAHRHLFRDYIVGEVCWDNTYTAILMCHADAAIENRRGLLRHEAHPSAPIRSPAYADHVGLLAALDAYYFHRWCWYWGRLVELREQGAPPASEAQLARDAFVWPPAWHVRALYIASRVKARLRHAMRRIAVE